MILVTGASGYIGSHLVARLLRDGHGVRCLVLPDDPAPALAGLDVERAYGDVLDANGLARHGTGVTAVVHAAALMLPNPASDLQRVNVAGTANVVQCARRWNVRRIVYLSAVSATYMHKNTYGLSKLAAEELIRESGLPYTVLRPTMVYGPGGGLHFQKLVRLLETVPVFFPVLGPGTARLQPVWIHDVVEAIVLALHDPRAAGKTYGVAGATTLTFNDLVDRLARARGRPRVRVHAPLTLCYAAVSLLAPFLGPRSFLSADALLGINEDATLDWQAFHADCGYQPRTLDEGLSELFGNGSASLPLAG